MTMPMTITPELAYLLEALRLAREMEARGVVLAMDQAHDLSLASLGPPVRWVAREPELTPKAREILDQIVAERERDRPSPSYWATARGGVSIRSERSGSPAPSAVDPGRGGTAARQHQRNRGRKRDILDEAMDQIQFPDDEEQP
jgi:hypothetical protein